MKKRIGILVDSLSVPKQIIDLIDLSTSSDTYEITTLIVNDIKKNKFNIIDRIIDYINRRGIKKFISVLIFEIILKFEKLIIINLKPFTNFFKKHLIPKENFEIINVTPSISNNGLIYNYNNYDLEQIRKAELDMIVMAGSGILRGEILVVCPNGVISFHHADNDVNRGGPPGFWEVYQRNPKTGFVIQRLKEELDGGDVLFKGFINTKWFYSLNLSTLYEVSNPFLHYVIQDLTSENSQLKVHKKSPYDYQMYTTPSVFESIYYLIKTIKILIEKLFRKITQKSQRWCVAYQFVENWKDATLWRSKKIPNPKNRFLADPFVVFKNNLHYCFVEDYNYKTKIGSISAYKINKDSYEELGNVLTENFHLSYPYIFEYNNELYMCPETHEKKEIRIYKCTDFPRKWIYFKTIMKNVVAADTAIFKHNEKWWLFTNIDHSIVGDLNCQLHIFYSSDPLKDEWIPHKLNPVIFDPLSARNGGLIESKNEIYRVYQRQGFNSYGEALGVAKINLLTPSEYSEEKLFSIEPKFFKDLSGTHTYNYKNGLLVIDYMKISNLKKDFECSSK